MSDKSQPPRRTPHVASPRPKRPYKALLIRAQSPEPTDENSTDDEATGSQKLEMNQTKNNAARKAPYKALLMRAKSPEPSDEEDDDEEDDDEDDDDEDDDDEEDDDEDDDDEEDDDEREEPNKKRRMPKKKNAPISISSEEPEVTQTVAPQEPEVEQTVAQPCNSSD